METATLSVGRRHPNSNKVSLKVEKIAIADIHVVGRHRDRDPSILGVFYQVSVACRLAKPDHGPA